MLNIFFAKNNQCSILYVKTTIKIQMSMNLRKCITYIIINTNEVIMYITVKWHGLIYVKNRIVAKRPNFKILATTLSME